MRIFLSVCSEEWRYDYVLRITAITLIIPRRIRGAARSIRIQLLQPSGHDNPVGFKLFECFGDHVGIKLRKQGLVRNVADAKATHVVRVEPCKSHCIEMAGVFVQFWVLLAEWFIDIDINWLEEQKYYRVEYDGDVYAVEKLADGKIVFYEVVE